MDIPYSGESYVYLSTPANADVLASHPVTLHLEARVIMYVLVFGAPVLALVCVYFCCAYRAQKRSASAAVVNDPSHERAPLAPTTLAPPQPQQAAPPAYTPTPYGTVYPPPQPPAPQQYGAYAAAPPPHQQQAPQQQQPYGSAAPAPSAPPKY